MAANGSHGWIQHDARLLPGPSPGQNYVAFQAEYRVPITSSLGWPSLDPTGMVAPQLEKFSGSIQGRGGAGFRFQVDKKERG